MIWLLRCFPPKRLFSAAILLLLPADWYFLTQKALRAALRSQLSSKRDGAPSQPPHGRLGKGGASLHFKTVWARFFLGGNLEFWAIMRQHLKFWAPHTPFLPIQCDQVPTSLGGRMPYRTLRGRGFLPPGLMGELLLPSPLLSLSFQVTFQLLLARHRPE